MGIFSFKVYANIDVYLFLSVKKAGKNIIKAIKRPYVLSEKQVP
jgi:hypothetical protein